MVGVSVKCMGIVVGGISKVKLSCELSPSSFVYSLEITQCPRICYSLMDNFILAWLLTRMVKALEITRKWWESWVSLLT